MKKSFLLLLTLTLLPVTNNLFAQGTVFTYQGQLQSSGRPASGGFDLLFILYDAGMGGSQVGPILTNAATAVSNGSFTVTLNFGAGIFTGGNYWLDISVRTNGTGSFNELSPRQPLTPAPYAIFANTASNVSGTIANSSLPASLTFSGTITANAFSGNGGGLSDLNASQLASGTIPLAQLPGTVVTNNEMNVTLGNVTVGGNLNLAGVINGDGSGLTNLNASQLTSGTLPLAQLPAPVVTNNEPVVSLGSLTLSNLVLSGNLLLPLPVSISSGGATFVSADLSANSYFGLQAGSANLGAGGSYNTGVGENALLENSDGFDNTAIGYAALSSNTNGLENTATGDQALYNNTSGSYNTANGDQALYSNTSGSQNTASGLSALYSNTSGAENTANGLNALYANTTGIGNIAIGTFAGAANTSGNNNIYIGNLGANDDDGNIYLGTQGVHSNTYLVGTVYANSLALTSDRNTKENFKPVDNQAVLAKVAALPMSQWNFKTDSKGVQHIGPMAQDFQAAFQLGSDDKHIAVVDEGGVALAAIQGLNQKLSEKDQEIQSLKTRNDLLAKRLSALEATVKSLAERK